MTRTIAVRLAAVAAAGTAALLTVPAGTALAAPAAPAYRVVDRGLLPGADYSYANAVNDSGTVVGESGLRAVAWKDGRITDLGVRRSSRAVDINDRGEVAGYYVTGESTSFTWSRGRLTDIPQLPDVGGFPFMQAQAISDRGVVVGVADFGGFGWDGRTLTRLPGLAGNGTAASDVTDRGAIVGSSGTTSGGLEPHAVLLLPRR